MPENEELDSEVSSDDPDLIVLETEDEPVIVEEGNLSSPAQPESPQNPPESQPENPPESESQASQQLAVSQQTNQLLQSLVDSNNRLSEQLLKSNRQPEAIAPPAPEPDSRRRFRLFNRKR